MKVFIVGVPLFDSTMTVSAYRLCDRSGERAIGIHNDFRRMTEALISPGLDLIEKIGLEPFAGEKPLFADLNMYQLLVGRPAMIDIDPTKLICVLPGNIPLTDMAVEKCLALKDMGYRLALEGMPEETENHPLLPLTDYLILDCLDEGFTAALFNARTYLPKIDLVISDIPDTETYERLILRNPKGLFTGGFYANPISEGVSELSPVKVNALQLLNLVNNADFEFDETVKIIERDPFLTVSLLRFINSAALGRKRKVDSLMNAVTTLGQKEIRRWATIAISISLAEDRPGEITKLALIRAKFAESLAAAFDMSLFQQSLFLTGLFSLIDIILQKPMEEALKEIALEERVKRALAKKQGNLYQVLELIFAYERADWDQCSIMMIRNGVSLTDVNQAYVDAVSWYHSLLGLIDQ